MPSEMKHRRKNAALTRQREGGSEQQPVKLMDDGVELTEEQELGMDLCSKGRPGLEVDVRTVLCLVSLMASAVLGGFMYQQAAKFADVEEKYQLLYMKSLTVQDLENEISKISKKLETSEEILQKALPSSSVMNLFEQEMAELRGSMNNVQTKEHAIAKKMQHVNKNFKTISDTWKESLDTINSEIAYLKSESKNTHRKISSEINAVEQGVKDLEERLEDLKVSTKQNTKAIRQQEEADLEGLETQLEWNVRTTRNLADQQNGLVAKGAAFVEKLTECDAKVKECQEQLPVIDSSIRSILKVTRAFRSTEKKIEELAVQMLELENSMANVISGIQEIKTQLQAPESNDGN